MRIMRKPCQNPLCNKHFVTYNANKKYCCDKCKKEARSINFLKQIQLCWTCGKCSDECEWIRRGVPVEGWIAEKTTIKNDDKDIGSFKVIQCKNYICEV